MDQDGETPVVRKGKQRVFDGDWSPLMVKIDPELKSALNDIARYREQSMSEIVRELVTSYVAQNRAKAAAGLAARLQGGA